MVMGHLREQVPHHDFIASGSSALSGSFGHLEIMRQPHCGPAKLLNAVIGDHGVNHSLQLALLESLASVDDSEATACSPAMRDDSLDPVRDQGSANLLNDDIGQSDVGASHQAGTQVGHLLLLAVPSGSEAVVAGRALRKELLGPARVQGMARAHG